MILPHHVTEPNEQLMQCVPNFSEGRDDSILQTLANTITASAVRLVDWSADVDHNRSVFTFVGSPANIIETSVCLARMAVQMIDLNSHTGVHPRIGVLDVLPVVPLANVTMDECSSTARTIAWRLSKELSLPVFFYDFASESFHTLPAVRKGAFKTMQPDSGPNVPHKTAGAVAVGARDPLVAFNVNLNGGTLKDAKRIAQLVRIRFDGGVRALGLYLTSKDVHQVSMNIIRTRDVTLSDVVQYIGTYAEILDTELIGAMPGYAAFSTIKSALRLAQIRPDQVLLENWPREH